jgi:hypothetical protein
MYGDKSLSYWRQCAQVAHGRRHVRPEQTVSCALSNPRDPNARQIASASLVEFKPGRVCAVAVQARVDAVDTSDGDLRVGAQQDGTHGFSSSPAHACRARMTAMGPRSRLQDPTTAVRAR